MVAPLSGCEEKLPVSVACVALLAATFRPYTTKSFVQLELSTGALTLKLNLAGNMFCATPADPSEKLQSTCPFLLPC